MSLRTLILALAGALAAVPAAAAPIEVTARPAPLSYQDYGLREVGRLRYRGGLELASPDPRFGGLSALGVSADGRRMIALSDAGFRLGARLSYDAAGDLAGLAAADLGALAGLDGRPLTAKRDADAEAMTQGARGELIVAFERRHRLWAYQPGATLPEPVPPPAELARAPANAGVEALTMLDDGRLFALTEGLGGDAERVGWVSDADGWSALTYAVEDGFSPTDAATLPGGDVITLERRFGLRSGGASARLKRVTRETIVPGARLEGSLLAELGAPLNVDNFEGVAARTDAAGRTLIYIVSDDNFNALQRTLLMMFELID